MKLSPLNPASPMRTNSFDHLTCNGCMCFLSVNEAMNTGWHFDKDHADYYCGLCSTKMSAWKEPVCNWCEVGKNESGHCDCCSNCGNPPWVGCKCCGFCGAMDTDLCDCEVSEAERLGETRLF